MNYVIIGNSTAAVGAVEGIRRTDEIGSITIITSEKYHTYSRPLISYYLQGKTDADRMKYRPDDFYQKNNCTLLYGTVEKIKKSKKSVVLDSGREVPYDKLCIATGSTPFVPPFEGLDKVKRKHTFMSLDDAKSLERDITPEANVLIIGAGLIGLKCAEGISAKVSKITVVDLSTRILSSILDDESSEAVKAHIEKRNVSFVLGHSVSSFEDGAATLDNGEIIPFDIIVLAVGVRPNTSLVSDAGGEVKRGIITDDNMKTSLDDIYAAGDCTESFDISSGMNRVLALLPAAYMQGECAGINMAGGSSTYGNAIPMNAIGFFGLHIITAGSYEGDVFIKNDNGNIKKLFYKDNLLKGYILVGQVGKAGIYTSLIRNMTPLDQIDFKLVCEEPSLMAFSKEYRDQKLGGAK